MSDLDIVIMMMPRPAISGLKKSRVRCGEGVKGRKEERDGRRPFGPSHLFFSLVLYVLICLTLGGWMTHMYIHRHMRSSADMDQGGRQGMAPGKSDINEDSRRQSQNPEQVFSV